MTTILNEVAARLQASLRGFKLDRPIAHLTTDHLADTIKQLTGEQVNKNGDGAVSVTSGRLDGVDDITILQPQRPSERIIQQSSADHR